LACEIGDDQVWLIWGFPEWAFAVLDEGRGKAYALEAKGVVAANRIKERLNSIS